MTLYDFIREFWGALAAVAGWAVGWIFWLIRLETKAHSASRESREEIKRGIERDARLRSLENRAERADERYNSIMALLQRIDKSVEQISRK